MYGTLPRRMTEPPNPEAASGPAILLVEDEAALRRMLVISLTRAGFDVIEAAGGNEALEQFAAHASRIRLLVTDVKMPDIRGPELATRIKEQAPRLPVLFITGYADREGIRGDDLLMHKPFTPAAFVAAVKDLLGS